MADPEAPKPSLLRRILLPLLAAAVALSAGGAAAFTQRSRIEPLLGRSSADSTAAPVEFGAFAEMEGIVINPRGTGGQRYLMLKVGVEAEEEKTLERLKELSPAAQDAVLSLLAAQTVSELTDVTRRDALKEQIRTEFNRLLGKDGPITRIYFTQYVIQ